MTGEAIESYKRKERALITPKQMAKHLFDKFYQSPHLQDDQAKICSLISVDEIIKEVPMYIGDLNPRWAYWQKVKKELNGL